jgi:hypothetical protein
MRARALRMAILALGTMLTGAGSAMAIAPDPGHPCQDERTPQQVAAMLLASSPAPTGLAKRQHVPEDCAAFIAGRTTSTSQLARCLRLMSAGPVVKTAAPTPPNGVASSSGARPQQAACRKDTTRRASQPALN